MHSKFVPLLLLSLSFTIVNGSPSNAVTKKTAYKDPEPSRDGPESLRVLDNYLETIGEYLGEKFYMVHDLSKRDPKLEEMQNVGRNLFVSAFQVSSKYLHQLHLVISSGFRDPCYGISSDDKCASHSMDIENGLEFIDSFDTLSMEVAEKVRAELKKSKEALNDLKISAELMLEQILYHLQKENNVISGFDSTKTVESFRQVLNSFGKKMISEKVNTPKHKEHLSVLQVELERILEGCVRGDIFIVNDYSKEIEGISGNFKAAFKVMDRLAIGMEKVSEVVIEYLSDILVDEEPNKDSEYYDLKDPILENLKVRDGLTLAQSHTDLKDLKRYYDHLSLWKRQADFLAYMLENCSQKAFYLLANA